MGGSVCTIDGNIDDSKFSEPMPWIGIYVATGSSLCALAMAIDAFHGFRFRKLWFPCKFFSLNATTLTLITVATKLSVDLNTPMPQKQDQLAKLSSSVLICTVIGNFMPSLGTMQSTELVMNIMALVIFVVTAIVNISIQLGTGVIYVFWKEHAAVMFLMLVLLVILLSSSLTIPITKSYFEDKYRKKYRNATKECNGEPSICVTQKMRNYLGRFWMMAHTCSPQFVMGRLATCTASGAVCLFSTLILLEAMLRCYLMPSMFKFCNGESDYKWSSTLILVTQITAIGIGSIAPAFRWLFAVNYRCPKKATMACTIGFQVENYWTRRLSQWKESPLVLRIRSRRTRKVVHNMKDKVLDLCIWMQISIVVLSKIIRLSSVYLMIRLKIVGQYWKTLTRMLKFKNGSSSLETEPESSGTPQTSLGYYVLHLEGEEKLIEVMTESNCDAADHFVRMGRKKQPGHLLQLLEKMEPSGDYNGVRTFDNDLVPSLNCGEPPNCWALPVVTLTTIALSLPKTENCLVKDLQRSINEALIFIRVVEDNLDVKGQFVNMRKAADTVWLGVDLHHKWLDVKLCKLDFQKTSPKEVLERLSCIAKRKFVDLKTENINGCFWGTPSMWPIKVLAANSMYRICQTLLLSLDGRESNQTIFERLSATATDIVGACLTNLKHVISLQCHGSRIEDREDSVRCAIILLGKTEKILKLLDQRRLPCLKPDQLAYIDEWRAASKSKNHQLLDSPINDSDSPSGSSSDLYLAIE